MNNVKFQNQYRIPPARANWHDYNGGNYFITICTKNREHYFGEIANDEMMLSKVGCFLSNNLENISTHYPYAEIPLFVIMPNHLHAIICIDTPCRDEACLVSDKNKTPIGDEACLVSTTNPMKDISNRQSLLSKCIGGIKSAITRYANQNNITFSWQTRFHDRIIRDNNEMNAFADYIENNVLNWALDSEFL
ncbi:MAG: transposase [Mangrovibacterium sp.]